MLNSVTKGRAIAFGILSIFLLAQAGAFYRFSRGEDAPRAPELVRFPRQVGPWLTDVEGAIDDDIRDALRADDLLTRNYIVPGEPIPATLFIAYFRSQRMGQTPHSPKNCLPGNGWVPQDTGRMTLADLDPAGPITINRYIVAKGQSRSLVLYWYQTPQRVIAGEFDAKWYMVADAIRYNRTDTALVRITIPVVDQRDDEAQRRAESFLRALYPSLREYFPS